MSFEPMEYLLIQSVHNQPERNPMGKDDTPKWGSTEFNEAVRKHDEKADPEREKKGLKYTKTRNPANPPKKADPPKRKGK